MKKHLTIKAEYFIPLILIVAGCSFAPWVLSQISVPICDFNRLTGFPCPFCGGTQSLAALGKLEFKNAISLNPLIMLSCTAAFIIIPAQMISEKIRQCPWGKIFLILLPLNWIYLVFVHLNLL